MNHKNITKDDSYVNGVHTKCGSYDNMKYKAMFTHHLAGRRPISVNKRLKQVTTKHLKRLRRTQRH